MLDLDRETNPEILRQTCFAYRATVAQLSDKVRELAERIAHLEGGDVAQQLLEMPDIVVGAPAEAPTEEPVPSPPKASPDRPKPPRGHGPTPQPDLPIQPFHHTYSELPSCGACGAVMQVMAGQFEESEEISVAEVSFHIALHQRQKYRCRCNGQVLTAPGPDKLIAGGRYSVDFAVHTAVSKFCDHLPLERQVVQMARQGLEITSQTLWDQHAALARHGEATWRALCQQALEESVLHVDETGWRVWSRQQASPKWTLFGLTSPRLAAYHLVPSKSTASARKLLKGYRGTLVVDGYQVYPKIAELEGTIEIAHCWAHADRKFKDAKDPPRAIAQIRNMIHQLYEIERKVEGPFPGDAVSQAQRLAFRRERSAPVISQIREWAFAQGGLRRSAFGKATAYLLKHWDGLTRFLQDPQVPLDNNAAERILRGPVVGRKNFYGNRSRRGAKVAAILYSLVQTAKLQGVDPAEYLRTVAVTAIRRPGAAVLPK